MKETLHTCTSCSKLYKNYEKYIRHLQMHTTSKQYQCPHCPKVLESDGKLRYHINQHRNFRPYLCPHKDCGRRWATSTALKSHLTHIHSDSVRTAKDCERFRKAEEDEVDHDLITGSLVPRD